MGTFPRTEQRTGLCAEPRPDLRPKAGIRGRLSVGLRLTAAVFAAFVVADSFARPPAGTNVTNTANASFVDSSGAAHNAQSNTATLTVANADVTVSLSVSSTSVAPMSTLTYTEV